MATVNELLDRVQDLPALPGPALRIINILNNPDTDLNEVERIIKTDEAIAMTVLRYANSARYGRPGRTFSLRESIARLGTKTLMKIALQCQICPMFSQTGTSYGLQLGAMQRGSLAGAIAAEEIARDLELEPELCFLGALLRDVGKIVLDMFATPEEMAEAASYSDTSASFLQIEEQVFGANHAEIGAELASRWNLPERIIEAIRRHHSPQPPGEEFNDPVCDVVHAADVICLWTGIATGFDGLQYPLAAHVRDGILGTRDRAEYYMTNMWARLTEAEAEMNADTAKGMTA